MDGVLQDAEEDCDQDSALSMSRKLVNRAKWETCVTKMKELIGGTLSTLISRVVLLY